VGMIFCFFYHKKDFAVLTKQIFYKLFGFVQVRCNIENKHVDKNNKSGNLILN
jgi:hypothetical protein